MAMMLRKMTGKWGLIIIGVCGFAGPSLAQQAFTYNQYMNNLTPINTAYAATREGGALHSVLRKQWVGIDGAPSLFMANGHLAIPRLDAAAGLVVLHDRIGVENLTETSAFFAKAVQLDESLRLAASLNAGVRFFNAGYSQLDPYDIKFRNDIRETIPTVGFGLLLHKPEVFYVGVSLPRINIRLDGDKETENAVHRNTWYISGGYLTPLDDDFSLKLASNVAVTPTLPPLIDLSAMGYIREQFGLGVGYRTSNDAVVILDYRAGNHFSVGYSYQANMDRTTIGTFRNGSHEITLGYRFGKLYRTPLL